MPRFVLLLHRTPPGYPRPDHFDLLLEEAHACRTWALAAEPAIGEGVEAEALPDHRTHYLDYEGPIAGNRGEVSQVERGTFAWVHDFELKVSVVLRSESLNGTLELTRSHAAASRWLCRFQPE